MSLVKLTGFITLGRLREQIAEEIVSVDTEKELENYVNFFGNLWNADDIVGETIAYSPYVFNEDVLEEMWAEARRYQQEEERW